MEDAYNELYNEFIHLRSISIRQAALLQKLSRELHKQQGSNGYLDEVGSLEVGSFSGMESIPVPLTATNQDALPHTGMAHQRTAGMTPFSTLLVEDMGKLDLNVPHQRKTNKEEGEESPQPTCPALRSPAVSGAASYEAHQRGERRVMQPYGMASQLAWAHNPLLDSEVLSASSGAFMSELELQSQVCEFCQAIFPGHTATQGEFLRHLHTHIT